MKTFQNTHVLVLISNIDNEQKAALVCLELAKIHGVHTVNVDLEDWENVLRVECHTALQGKDIEEKMAQLGFQCAELVH